MSWASFIGAYKNLLIYNFCLEINIILLQFS